MTGNNSGFWGLKGTSMLLYSLARLLETMGARNTALNMFRALIHKSPQSPWLHIHASRVCLKKGQVDMAVNHWKKATAPEDMTCFIYWLQKTRLMPAPYHRTGGRSIAATGYYMPAAPVKKPGVESLSPDNGLALLEQGRANDALDVFGRELQSQKSDPGLLLNTGLALSMLDRHHEALVFYEKAQELGLNNLELLNNKGYSLFNLRRYEEALTCYELARTMAPDDYTVLNNLAACYARTGQTAKAVHFFNSAVNNNPTDPVLLNNRAMLMELCGQPREALELYDRALDNGKDNGLKNTVLINKVNCLIKLGKYRYALQACEKILPAGDGSEFELWNLRAELLTMLGRTREAADSYRKALGLTG